MVTSIICCVLSRLTPIKRVLEDIEKQITDIMGTSSNAKFNGTFASLAEMRRLGIKDAMKTWLEILDIGNMTYTELDTDNEWIIGKSESAFNVETETKPKTCHNCRKKGHILRNCRSSKNNKVNSGGRTPWYLIRSKNGEPTKRKLRDGRWSHWCTKCNPPCSQTSHDMKGHKLPEELKAIQENKVLLVDDKFYLKEEEDEEISINPKNLDNMSNEEVKELGVKKLTALSERLAALAQG